MRITVFDTGNFPYAHLGKTRFEEKRRLGRFVGTNQFLKFYFMATNCLASPMRIDPKLFQDRVDIYKRHLGWQISGIINKGQEESLNYQPNDFEALLNKFDTIGTIISKNISGVRAYFASYKVVNSGTDNNNLFIPFELDGMTFKDEKITVLYAATQTMSIPSGKKEETIANTYFIINERVRFSHLPDSIAQRWIDNYEIKRQILSMRTLPLGREQTKSLWYPIDSIRKLLDEINCWHREAVQIDLLKVALYFSAYTHDEKIDGEDVSFQLTHSFALENSDKDFLKFDNFLNEKFNINGSLSFRILGTSHDDTAHPCPPNTNCP